MQYHGINFKASFKNWRPKGHTGGSFEPKTSQSNDYRVSMDDIYRPSNPHLPGIVPGYPDKPLWLPSVPTKPLIEVPNNFPMEFPTYPGLDEWANPPETPNQLPDWSKVPISLPNPGGPEITLPKELPSTPFITDIPDKKCPGKSAPEGTWFFS